MDYVTFEYEDDEPTIFAKVQKFQRGLIAAATQDDGGIDAETFTRLRQEILGNPLSRPLAPDIVKKYRSNSEFWQFIKPKFAHYQERRTYIWDEFRPLLDHLEALDRTPSVAPISAVLESFDPDNVRAVWQKALDRRDSDPEGAITAARTLIETVCKHILDDVGETYPDDVDLPKLWAQASEHLNLAPHQHQEVVFKAILGNCQSIVNYLGSIRNKIGDSHGQGRKPVKPKPRHAELVVNLAGTMASFLISTWIDRPSTAKS